MDLRRGALPTSASVSQAAASMTLFLRISMRKSGPEWRRDVAQTTRNDRQISSLPARDTGGLLAATKCTVLASACPLTTRLRWRGVWGGVKK